MLGYGPYPTGGKVCGSRFVYLTGYGALLELALVNWAFAKVGGGGYTCPSLSQLNFSPSV